MEGLPPEEASRRHKMMGYKHECPKCHCAVGFKEKRDVSIFPWFMRKYILYERCCKYCTFCGQELDWSHVP